MAALNNALVKNLTSSETAMFTPDSTDLIMGCKVTNTTASQILIDVYITRSTVKHYIGFQIPVPAGGAYEFVEENAKFAMKNGDILYCLSDTATSADSVVTFLDDFDN